MNRYITTQDYGPVALRISRESFNVKRTDTVFRVGSQVLQKQSQGHDVANISKVFDHPKNGYGQKHQQSKNGILTTRNNPS